MTATSSKYTRGKGLLEPLLARLRTQRANQLIPKELRDGRILDIGCGSYPYFLAHTAFKAKFAVDQLPMPQETARQHNIEFFELNLNSAPKLPFEAEYSASSRYWRWSAP
jgi:hypothetical protein